MREEHLLRLLQAANRRIEELEAERLRIATMRS
jgi:hypothetical protein